MNISISEHICSRPIYKKKDPFAHQKNAHHRMSKRLSGIFYPSYLRVQSATPNGVQSEMEQFHGPKAISGIFVDRKDF